MQTTETVYKDSDNINSVLFYEDHVAMDFSAITRIVCSLHTLDGDIAQTIDTNDSPVLMTATDLSQSPNVLNIINFSFNDLALLGRYYAHVIVYDATHPSGQTIAHPKSPDDLLCFNFVDA